MNFQEKIINNKFLVTAELFPPKGTDISSFMQRASYLKGVVDAVNVTDNQRASVRIGSLAMCKLLLDIGIEPVLQITCRDKNRIALQSEMLSAYVLDIKNVLLLSGDRPETGEEVNAKPVFDLDTVSLIKTARLLETGKDLAGKELKGSPKFCIGAVVNPYAQPQEEHLAFFKKKIKAGAEFFQTQTIFDVAQFKGFYEKTKDLNVKVLPGITLIKSQKFMEFLKKLPGVDIPLEIQERINKSSDPLAEGMKIASETIKELRSFADGVHIMAIGMEECIPEIIKNSLK